MGGSNRGFVGMHSLGREKKSRIAHSAWRIRPWRHATKSQERFELNRKPYHDYYLTRPDAPFCRTHIDPKLAMLRQRFAPYYEVP